METAHVIEIQSLDSKQQDSPQQATGGNLILENAVCIPTGSTSPNTQAYSIFPAITSSTTNEARIEKPLNVNVRVTAKKTISDEDALKGQNNETIQQFTAPRLKSGLQSENNGSSGLLKKVFHRSGKGLSGKLKISENPKTNIPMSSKGNNSDQKSPVIMFKWGSVNKPFRCQICDMSFTDGSLLRVHIEKHSNTRKEPSKPFPCNLCVKSFQSSRSLERHQFVHSGQSQKRCKYCYKVFANKENLDKHVQMHKIAGNKSYSCVFCSEQFTTRPALEKHIALSNHIFKTFGCKICGKPFNRKDTLDRHLLTHDASKKNKHECVECQKSFKYLFALKRHVRSVHANEPDGKKCELCGKFIKNRENIARHMLLHEGLRPYQCNECGRKFTQKQHLVDHMVTHTNALPFECKLCRLSFRFRRSLSRHLKKHYIVHSDPQMLSCLECSAVYPTEKELLHHAERVHFNVKECLICGKIFTNKKACLNHMRKDHFPEIAIGNKEKTSSDLLDKSTETDLVGPERDTELGQVGCDITDSDLLQTDEDMDINPVEEQLENKIEKLSEFANANRRIVILRKADTIQSKDEEGVSEDQEVIYILFDNGKENGAFENMDVKQVTAQSGNEVIQYIKDQFNIDGDEVERTLEPEIQSLDHEPDTEKKPEIIKINTLIAGNEVEEHKHEHVQNAADTTETYPDLCEKNETDAKEVECRYNIAVSETELEIDGIEPETEESKFAAERSKLLQSLIDYAEKMQEVELSMSGNDASCSETKI